MLIQNSHPPLRLEIPEPHWRDENVPQGWLPASVEPSRGVIRWIQTGSAQLLEPFFHESVASLRAGRPAAFEYETELSVLEKGVSGLTEVAPAGIICHMTRCGSTLVLNALRTEDNVIGLGEAPCMQTVMHLAASPFPRPAQKYSVLLAPLTTVFAHYRGLPAGNVVIKPSIGGIVTLGALRAIWPNLPCLILVRNPVEVLVSNIQRFPQWIYNYDHPEEFCFGPPPPDVLAAGVPEFLAWGVGRFCAEALARLDDKCKVVDYDDLSPETVADIAVFFGLSISPNAVQNFRRVFQVDAKHMSLKFARDTEAKRLAADDSVRQRAERRITPFYDELRRQAAVPTVKSEPVHRDF